MLYCVVKRRYKAPIHHMKLIFRYFLFSLLCTLAYQSKAQLIINEISSKNNSQIQDEDNEYNDWIELYNSSENILNLTGYYLSDNENEKEKWAFPTQNISPNSYFLVFASGKNKFEDEFHSNFKLSQDGETVYLSLDGEITDSLSVPFLRDDHSYGIWESKAYYFTESTPGAINNTKNYLGYHPTPRFSPEGYLFSSKKSIDISTYPNISQISYRINNNELIETSSDVFESIELDKTMTIQATAWNDNYIVSEPISRTYFYDVDSDMRTFSISADPDLLWSDENGIYVLGNDASDEFPYYGANFWKDITIPVYIEYFKKSKSLIFEGSFGTKINGGSQSRTQDMKALRIVVDDEYGMGDIDHQFFKNKEVDEFKRLILRNSSSDFNKKHFTDAFIHKSLISGGLDIDMSAYRPVAVFINGEYFGIHNLRERIDEYFLESNYGIDEDNVDIIEDEDLILEGDLTAINAMFDYVAANDLSIDSNVEGLSTMLDINSFIDYFIAETYFNNYDWPGNNIKLWREKVSNAKWRYFLVDLDVSLNSFGWAFHDQDNLGRVINEFGANNKHTLIFTKLLENESFRENFINRYADLINSVFTKENLRSELEGVVENLEFDMPKHMERWNGPGMDTWRNTYVEDEAGTFIDERPDYARQYIAEAFALENPVTLNFHTYPPYSGEISINTLDSLELPWEGVYFNGVPVQIKAEANEGYTFKGWQHSDDATLHTESEMRINYSEDLSIVALFEPADGAYDRISIYPNPSEYEINFDFLIETSGEVTMEVFDPLGRLMLNETYAMSIGFNSIKINKSDLSNGHYIVKLTTPDYVETQRIHFVKL